MAPTPKKEIERQHAAATALIDGNMSCVDSVAIERGEIPLKWKTVPTVENPLYGSAASVSGDAGRGEEEVKRLREVIGVSVPQWQQMMQVMQVS